MKSRIPGFGSGVILSGIGKLRLSRMISGGSWSSRGSRLGMSYGDIYEKERHQDNNETTYLMA